MVLKEFAYCARKIDYCTITKRKILAITNVQTYLVTVIPQKYFSSLDFLLPNIDMFEKLFSIYAYVFMDTFFWVGKNFQNRISKKHNIYDNFLTFFK